MSQHKHVSITKDLGVLQIETTRQTRPINLKYAVLGAIASHSYLFHSETEKTLHEVMLVRHAE